MIRLGRRICLFVFLSVLTNVSFANVSVSFELINGLIIVEAEINGAIGNYIVDSGSNGILLNGNSEKSDISYQTLNTSLEGTERVIESFKVGDFEASELLVFSTDLSNLESYLDKRIAGIVGCSIFTPHSLVFDFSNSEMLISDRVPSVAEIKGLKSLAYELVDGLPIVELQINTKIYSFILDSGASSHFIDQSFDLSHAKIFKPTGVKKSIITAGGEAQTSLEYAISNCNIGGDITSMKAFSKDFSLLSGALNKKISGLLSLSKLSTEKVYFDLNSKKFYYN